MVISLDYVDHSSVTSPANKTRQECQTLLEREREQQDELWHFSLHPPPPVQDNCYFKMHKERENITQHFLRQKQKKINNDQHMGLALLSWLMMLAKSKLKRSATARKSQGQSEPILNEHAKDQNKLFHHLKVITYFGKRSTKKIRFRSLICWYV